MGLLGLFTRNKLKNSGTGKREGFDGWIKCTGCETMVHSHLLKESYQCCPHRDYHYRMSAQERIALLADRSSFLPLFEEVLPQDPLSFSDTQPYTDRLSKAQQKTGCSEAVLTGRCLLKGRAIALAVFDFAFMGGSMGSVVGERITRLIEYAAAERLPLVVVSASGGARMQESIFSLMQMGKTTAALSLLDHPRLPFISVLTNPTTGGVTASFASLGDVILAEPNALIGFAGPRVVEQTMGQKIPESAQKSEFLLEHGMVDAIVKRSGLKEMLSLLLFYLSASREREKGPLLEQLVSIGEKISPSSSRRERWSV